MRQDFWEGVKGPWSPFPQASTYDLPFHQPTLLATFVNPTKWLIKIPCVCATKPGHQFLVTWVTCPPQSAGMSCAIAVDQANSSHSLAL